MSIDDDHKLHVVGCLEFSLMLFNRTVSAFPVDCFQIPSHQHRIKEEKAINLFGNWMPWWISDKIIWCKGDNHFFFNRNNVNSEIVAMLDYH